MRAMVRQHTERPGDKLRRARNDLRGVNGQTENGWNERDESNGSDSELHDWFGTQGVDVVVTNEGEWVQR